MEVSRLVVSSMMSQMWTSHKLTLLKELFRKIGIYEIGIAFIKQAEI